MSTIDNCKINKYILERERKEQEITAQLISAECIYLFQSYLISKS